MTWGTASRTLGEWWQQFKVRHIVSPDPWDGKASSVLAVYPIKPRIMPVTFRRPNGRSERGWKIVAQNDAARAELLYCVDCLPHSKAV